jgi:hypothetical protein
LSKNRDKTVILAMHHPLMSNGSHGGQFSIEKQIFPLEQKIPLPVIGSFINLLRKDRGVLKISKQTIHCLCKTHQNSFTKPRQRDSSIRP